MSAKVIVACGKLVKVKGPEGLQAASSGGDIPREDLRVKSSECSTSKQFNLTSLPQNIA